MESLSDLIKFLRDGIGPENPIKKIAVLVYEFNAPFVTAFLSGFELYSNVYLAFSNFFRDIKSLDKNADFWYFTGVRKIPMLLENSSSVFNVPISHSVFDNPFYKYYGITEDEIKCILKNIKALDLLEELKISYDGYHSQDEDPNERVSIYNHFSLMKCLQNERFEKY